MPGRSKGGAMRKTAEARPRQSCESLEAARAWFSRALAMGGLHAACACSMWQGFQAKSWDFQALGA